MADLYYLAFQILQYLIARPPLIFILFLNKSLSLIYSLVVTPNNKNYKLCA